MDFKFIPMNEIAAHAITSWRYEKPYDRYNVDPDDMDRTLHAFIDPRNGYFAVRVLDELVGFCCFGPDARVPGGDYLNDHFLDVGLGLRPDLTGQGVGPAFVRAIVEFGAEMHRPAGFRLTVAIFNQRAIRAYKKAGFRAVSPFTVRRTGKEESEWVIMVTDSSPTGTL